VYDLRHNTDESIFHEFEQAMKWITPSEIFVNMCERIPSNPREDRCTLKPAETAILFDVRKLTPDPDIESWCSAFLALESRKENDQLLWRNRPIMEPLLNDIIAQDPHLMAECRVHYTPKDVIRRYVASTPGAIQYDMAAWFDQLSLDEAVRRFFGVRTSPPSHLNVLPMGYRPSCRVAQALTAILMDVEPRVPSASCVDNVIFYGEEEILKAVAAAFLARCNKTCAMVKDTSPVFTAKCDFRNRATMAHAQGR
jgi:hypothetical protein